MNGYRVKQFNKVALKARKGPWIKNNDGKDVGKKVSFPYIKGTKENIAKISKRGNIKVSFSPPNALRKLLDHAKDMLSPRLQKDVYFVPGASFLLW